MEVPRLGAESELQLPGYVTATATADLGNIRSEPHLPPTPQLTAIGDAPHTERGQGLNLRPHGY